MTEPNIRVPVTCPECGKESLIVFPVSELANSLLLEEPIMLRSVCHDQKWQASDLEMDQLREYLSELCPADRIVPPSKGRVA